MHDKEECKWLITLEHLKNGNTKVELEYNNKATLKELLDSFERTYNYAAKTNK